MYIRRYVLARYAGFYRSLQSSPCREVTILARMVAGDIRTTTTRNLKMHEIESGTWAAPVGKVREGLAAGEPAVPNEDTWRISYLGKLLEERDKLVYSCDDEEKVDNVQELNDSLCVN